MNIKLLIEQILEFLSLKGDCTGSFESTLVKMPHLQKSHHGSNGNNNSLCLNIGPMVMKLQLTQQNWNDYSCCLCLDPVVIEITIW